MKPDRYSIRDAFAVAEQMVGVPGWMAYAWESLPGGYVVTGCVPAGIYSRGPRKGRPRVHHPGSTNRRQVIVTPETLAGAAQAYERAGRCWDCKGEGKVAVGWHHETGTRYSPCERCQATRRAKDVVTTEPP